MLKQIILYIMIECNKKHIDIYRASFICRYYYPNGCRVCRKNLLADSCSSKYADSIMDLKILVIDFQRFLLSIIGFKGVK